MGLGTRLECHMTAASVEMAEFRVPLFVAGLLALFWGAQAGYPWPTNVTQVHGYIEVRRACWIALPLGCGLAS